MKYPRRYYFHHTLSAAFVVLGIPEQTRPDQTAPHGSPEHIAWIAEKVARMSLTEPTDAQQATVWIVKLADGLVYLDVWTEKQRQALIARDFLEKNEQSIVHRLLSAA